MRIVLSRKFFDSATGGKPSAILPDGRLVPFPIPVAGDPVSFGEVSMNSVPIGPVVNDLTRGQIGLSNNCHLDPDLVCRSVPREIGWRPAFGQIGGSQTHLDGHGVSVGDIFCSSVGLSGISQWTPMDGCWR